MQGLGQKVLFKGARSLGLERGRDGAGGDSAGAIGHAVGHLKDMGKACVRDRAAGLGVLLLFSDGAVLVKTNSVVLLVVGAGDRIGVEPGVKPEELVRVALHGARGRRCGRRTWGGRCAA